MMKVDVRSPEASGSQGMPASSLPSRLTLILRRLGCAMMLKALALNLKEQGGMAADSFLGWSVWAWAAGFEACYALGSSSKV